MKRILKKLYTKKNSAQALLDFAKEAEKIPIKPGIPTDISINHDYYAWGGERKQKT